MNYVWVTRGYWPERDPMEAFYLLFAEYLSFESAILFERIAAEEVGQLLGGN